MTEKVELKPCPFCGGRAKFSKDGEQKVKYGNEQIYCTQCFITAAPQETEQEAVDWWNTRASAQPATEWVEIRTKDDLPKEDGDYWVYQQNPDGVTFPGVEAFENGHWVCVDKSYPVIAYLPIPPFTPKETTV